MRVFSRLWYNAAMSDTHLPTLLAELTELYEAADGLQVYVYEQLTEQKRKLRAAIERVELLISEQPPAKPPVEQPCVCGKMHEAGHGDCGCPHCD